LTSLAVKLPQHPPLYSVLFIRMHDKKEVCSTVMLDMPAVWHLPSTTESTVAVVQLPC